MRRWTIPMLAIAIAITALFTLLPVTAQAATSGYYTYETFNGGVMITDVKIGISGNVSIPTTLGGKPVLAIGSRAFQGCTNLTGITIPNSVTSIGVSAFSNCTNLTTVKMGNGITELNGFTFAQCYKLTDVTLPNNLTVMASSEFQDCTSLKSITIPDTVTSIGQNVFTGCSSLEDITIPFVGASKKIADNTYQYPLGYLFGTTTYTGGVETTQYYRASGSTSDISSTYYIPASLKSVTVTGGEVAYGAFYNCAGLQSITIPDTATSISARTFYGCSGLESFVLPEGVVSIGSQAFGGCSSLTDIRIPGSVTEIGSSAFFGCVGLTDLYITDPSAWCRINFVGSQASNPAQLADRMHIVDADENEIQEVVLESSVTTIPQYAFHGCSHLISITISDGVTDIGDYAFSGCSELTNIIIPNSVTHIGKNVFSGCSKLERMTIPFVGESRKTSSDTYQYPLGYLFGESSYSGGVATEQHYFGADTLRSVSSTYYIPASLKEVAVMDGKILYGAFMNCTGLTGVVIGDGVSSIGDRAFMNCTELTDISISDSVTFIDSGAFNSCSKLACVVLTSGYFNTIWENTFYTCNSLVSIAIPDTVTSVRKAAFYNCNSLCHVLYGGTQAQKNEMLVSGSNERLTNTFWHYEATGDEVYYRKTCAQEGWYCSICERFLTSTATGIECQYSASVIPPTCCDEGFTTHICTVCGDRYIDNYTEPTGIHTYEGAFCTQCGACVLTFYAVDGGASYSVLGCDKAFTGALEIPASYEGIPVRVINSGAFRDCTGLTSVTIPNSVTTIGASAFYGCTNLETVTLSTSIKAIPMQAFWGCTKLTNVTIPNGVTEIDHDAFMNCSSLTSITIPDTVTKMGESVFEGCTALQKATIGSGIDWRIGARTFYGCTALKEVTIPDTVMAIAASAFSGCSGLTDVYYSGTLAQKEAITMVSDNDPLLSATWHCKSLLTFALNADGQSYYLAKCDTAATGEIVIPDTYEGLPVTRISIAAFENCTSITSVVIPDSVTQIGKQAFFGCSGLTSVTLPRNITTIDRYLFYGCSSLTGITIPEGVTSIGEGAFEYCSALTELAIPTTVTSIEGYAFMYCSDLTEIAIPEGVANIGKQTFFACEDLVSVSLPESITNIGIAAFYGCEKLADVYYSGTAAQKETIMMASDNDPLLSATWHCEGEPEYTAGDLNRDGNINSLDGLMLMRYLNGWNVNIAAPEAMDVNADGKVNSLDGLLLMRYLNGWNVTLG